MCVLIFSLCSGQSSALANLFVFTSSQIEWSSHQAVNPVKLGFLYSKEAVSKWANKDVL